MIWKRVARPRFFPWLAGLVLAGTMHAADAARAFRLPSLYHVGFWVRDIERARVFYRDFLGYAEPYELRRPNGDLQMVVMKVNERQVIYLFTDATKIKANGDNLDHLGLETDHIAAAREHLLARGVKVGEVGRGRIGDLLLGVKDPDGHLCELTQFEPEGQLLKHQGQALAPGRISARLRSATIAVADLPAALRFYEEVLGCKKIAAPAPAIVRLQVPDGTDFLDLVPYELKPGDEPARSVPDYCLEVDDVPGAIATLTTRAKNLGFPPPAAMSRSAEGRRQTSVVDPDGTRVILREAKR